MMWKWTWGITWAAPGPGRSQSIVVPLEGNGRGIDVMMCVGKRGSVQRISSMVHDR